MCGICGIVDFGRPVDREEIVVLRDAMTHRGPDDAGVFLGDGVGLGHRRLSIIDLSSAGHQPMANDDESLWIIYNGEIYNFVELRGVLMGRGHRFKSQSDTEVLLRGYEEWGLQGLLERLNGIFAFCIWDARKRALFGARDHMGVKPFYYVDDGARFVFASEIKALLVGGHPFEVNASAIEEQIVFRYVAGERTLVEGVRRLLPGHWFEVDAGGLRTGTYWSPIERSGADEKPSTPEDIEHCFRDSVSMQLVSDVPVGVLCSGGLDSSLIAALAAGEIDELNTFCVAFGEDGFDDSPFARMVSERYRTDHHELVVGPEDYATELAEAVWMNDEPLAHGHESQLLGIAKMAKERVTVLLSGEGADELFGGYGRYDLAGYGHFLTSRPGRVIGRVLTPIMRGRWSRRVDKLLAHTQMSQDDSILFNSSGVLRSHLDHLKWDWEGRFPYRRAVLDEIQRAGARRMSVAMLYDQAIFIPSLLDRNDKMTMGASIECRVPFLNHRLVEQANNLPSTWKRHRGVGKRVLRDRLGTLLPQPLLDRSKVGFGVPMGGWFRRSETLKRMVSDLCRGDFVRMGIFSASAVSSLVDRHLRGDEELGGILWNLLALELWHSETRSRLATSAKSVSSVP